MDEEIPIFILSLLTSERFKYVKYNLNNFPILQVVKSVNGYSKLEVINTLIALKLNFIRFDISFHNSKNPTNFNTYGSLANFLTKYKMLLFQVFNKIPYICFIEDDLILHNEFNKFINNCKDHFIKDPNLNMIRLDKWGEGYITSLDGAKRIIEIIKKTGIITQIDNQLRMHCGKELRIYNTPWQLKIVGNKGDCLKTSLLEKNFGKIVKDHLISIIKNKSKINTGFHIKNKKDLIN